MASKTGRGDALALALARGLSIRAAAKASGYSERQAHRKLDDAEFRQRVAETRAAIVGRAVGILTAAGTEAARTLRKLLRADSEQIRLAAAKSILDLGATLRGPIELAGRGDAPQRIVIIEDPNWCNNDAHEKARAAAVATAREELLNEPDYLEYLRHVAAREDADAGTNGQATGNGWYPPAAGAAGFAAT